MTLIKSIDNYINRLNFSESYVYLQANEFISQIGFSKRSDESTSKAFLGKLSDLDLESIIDNNKVLTAEFYTYDYSSKSLVKPNGVFSLLKNRIRTEIAGILPFIELKNSIYQSIGVQLGECTISPKVFMDYLNPSLISIGDESIIGEAAKLQAHFFNPGKCVIGNISVGKRCVIGAGARLLPGTVINDYSTIGVDSTVSGYVPTKTKINPKTFYKKF
ncbi:MAG TPA: hypothetical protein VI790_06380 [Candidatus Nanoarchaeia archaeon]|nr:hypothetical protein [Candidatus Nanoarchaeia archaeon]